MLKIFFYFLPFIIYDVYTYPSNNETNSGNSNVHQTKSGLFKDLRKNMSKINIFQNWSRVSFFYLHSFASTLDDDCQNLYYRNVHEFGYKSPAALIKEGNTLCNKKKYSDAIEFFDEAVRVQPTETSFAARGQCYETQGRLDLAIPDYEEAVRSASYPTVSRRMLIEAYMRTGEWEKAADESLKHTSTYDIFEYAKAFCRQEKYVEAIRLFHHLIITEPQEMYYKLRAECRIKMGDLDNARKDCEAAAEFDKSLNVANKAEYGTVKFCQALFKFDKFEEALKEMPALKENQLTVIKELYNKGKFTEAIPFYNVAIERFPKNKEFYHKRGKCYKEIKDFGKAVIDFQKVMDLESSCRDCCVDLIEAMVEAGSYEDAKNVLRNNGQMLHTGLPPDAERRLEKAKINMYRALEKANLETVDKQVQASE